MHRGKLMEIPHQKDNRNAAKRSIGATTERLEVAIDVVQSGSAKHVDLVDHEDELQLPGPFLDFRE